ncbi:MAG: YggT family protein [Armatimonadota bacterium]
MVAHQVLQVVRLVLYAFYIMIFVRVIASWTRVSPYDRTWGPIISLAERVTDPLLDPIRRVIRPYQRGVGIDFSPLVLWMVLELAFMLIKNMLVGSAGGQ